MGVRLLDYPGWSSVFVPYLLCRFVSFLSSCPEQVSFSGTRERFPSGRSDGGRVAVGCVM